MRRSVRILLHPRGDRIVGYFSRRQDVAALVKDAVANAVADATNAVTLAGHMAQCEKDKAELKAEQLRMHNENNIKFKLIEDQNAKIMRIVYIATGVLATLHLVVSEKGAAFLSHFGL
ncbi:MAG TPA: hypothetical protein VKS24_25090 [Bradyrhizobium sp.]|nr:hypothetical protein [Bradyrhizobium sp.]